MNAEWAITHLPFDVFNCMYIYQWVFLFFQIKNNSFVKFLFGRHSVFLLSHISPFLSPFLQALERNGRLLAANRDALKPRDARHPLDRTPSPEDGVEHSRIDRRRDHRRDVAGINLHVPRGPPGLRPLPSKPLLHGLLLCPDPHRRQPRLPREPLRLHRPEARGRAPQRPRLRDPYRRRYVRSRRLILLQIHQFPQELHPLLRLLRSRHHGRLDLPGHHPAVFHSGRRHHMLPAVVQFHCCRSPVRLFWWDSHSSEAVLYGVSWDNRRRLVYKIA